MTDESDQKSKPFDNFLKVRDDRDWVKFHSDDKGDPTAGEQFELIEEEGAASPAWTQNGTFKLTDLRARVEPWLTSLFQSEHLSLLAGSGLTTAVHILATGKPATGMSGGVGAGKLEETINRAAATRAERAKRSQLGETDTQWKSNIEDKIRVANELLQGYEVLEQEQNANEVKGAIEDALKKLTASVLNSEFGIATTDDAKREMALGILVNFLASFASRTGTRGRLNIFTTNYDRLIEEGADLAGIHLLDRFVGTLSPIFRSSRLGLDMHYNPPGIRGEPRYLEGVVRFAKLHGSLDWVQTRSGIRRPGVPFGAENVTPYLQAPGFAKASIHELMIYPNSSKDRETAGFPYVDLFRDLAAALCRPNSTLVTYGYGFGDDHINRVIEDMLTIPSTHLVVISRDDAMGRMKSLAQKRPAQVSLLIGPALSDITRLTTHFLPKAAIDLATSRMSELLNNRYGATGKESSTPAASAQSAMPAVVAEGVDA